MFWRRRAYDRGEILAAADRARARGRVKKAITLYRQVLAAGPGDLAVHAKLAPLLARTAQRAEALASFRLAAQGQVRAGFPDRAIALHRQAVDHYPEELAVWEEITQLHLQRGRRADAVAALLGGGRRLLRTPHLTVGVQILQRALELEPWQPEVTMALARTYWRSRRRSDALALLDGLASLTRGKTLRRARGLALRIRPSPANLWRWLRAVIQARAQAGAPVARPATPSRS